VVLAGREAQRKKFPNDNPCYGSSPDDEDEFCEILTKNLGVDRRDSKAQAITNRVLADVQKQLEIWWDAIAAVDEEIVRRDWMPVGEDRVESDYRRKKHLNGAELVKMLTEKGIWAEVREA
jgi:hypothetical protein